jgi:hypothetical protein
MANCFFNKIHQKTPNMMQAVWHPIQSMGMGTDVGGGAATSASLRRCFVARWGPKNGLGGCSGPRQDAVHG